MDFIGSYVFFDIETTGLPYKDLGNTKITEMTMIGVARCHFDIKPFSVPRVMNSLTLCLNPRGYISDMASKITGLTNEMLDVMGPFNEKVSNMMTSFIEGLPQPVCLLAHNGNRFDFPILQSHLNLINMTLPDNLLCGDTLTAFRALKVMDECPSKWRLLHSQRDEEENCDEKENDKVEEKLVSASQAIDEVEYSLKNTKVHLLLNDNNDALFSQINEVEVVSTQFGYSTPGRPLQTQPHTPIKKNNEGDLVNSRPKAKRQLFSSNQPSYKLISVHKHVTGNDISNAHSSYFDTLAMLNIVSAIGFPFHEWLLENAVLFSTVKKMW